MEIIELATILFRDGDSGEPAVAIVRKCESNVAVSLSIQQNGDLEVLLDVASAQKLANAIKHGVDLIERDSK